MGLQVEEKAVKDRKGKIENVIRQAVKLEIDEHEMALAWHRLCVELEHMAEPEARPPRFNRLLDAIWIAATNEQS